MCLWQGGDSDSCAHGRVEILTVVIMAGFGICAHDSCDHGRVRILTVMIMAV